MADDEFYDDPWEDWLERYLLTREDGLWLSDGMDWAPPGLIGILLDKGADGLVLTGDRSKILALAGLDAGVKKEVIVSGHWRSADDITVRMDSVFVQSRDARQAAQQLIEEEPMLAWLPSYSEDSAGEDYLGDEKPGSIPWLVHPSPEGKLDKDDPAGSVETVRRPRIARPFADKLTLHNDDPFGRIWKDRKGRVIAHSAVWGASSDSGDESGVHLTCTTAALKDLLATIDADVLLLIRLQKYDRGFRHESGQYTYSLAVARITKALDLEYYEGCVNYVYKYLY